MSKKGKRIGAVLLVIALTVTTLFNGITFNNNEAKAAEVPESIKMPIVIYDHMADGLLFEYDLYDSIAGKLSLESSTFTAITGASENGQGLIESELGENGTPVYKKEVVEKVAELVKDYMEKEETVDFDLYNQLVSQIVKEKGSETIILGPEVYELGLNQLGWNFSNATYAPEDDDDYWKDSEGNIVWYRDGDWLYTNGGTENKAVFNFGELEAGEYELTYYDATNVDIVISFDGKTVAVTKSGTDFKLDAAAEVTLTVSAKDDNEGNITAPNLKDASGEKIYNNFTKPQDQKISKLGWVFDADSSWTNSQWGGITCDHGEETDIYYVQKVNPGKTYSLDSHNENDLLSVTVTDMNGNKIGEGEEKFTIPNDVDQVKIVLSCVCDDTETKTIRFDELELKQYPDVTLGDYETSKEKFSKGAKIADVSSCMDYAYYMLNNFWTDTNGDITQKTDLYKAIKLNLNDKYYNFSTKNKVNYDLENGEISEDVNDDTHIGFFPLDTTLLGDKSDLSAPYGEGTDLYNQYDGMEHNYHFSMRVHCEFLYKEADNLLFKFNGDDDVYLFIDKKLVLDIGGAHEKEDGYVDVNEVAKSIGLEEGEIYSFDFFYMERHTTASNLTIETNMILEQAEAKPEIVLKDKDGNVLENGAKVTVGEEVGIEYSVKAGSDNMSDVTFSDNILDVKIGQEGTEFGNEDVYVKDSITVTVTDADGNIKETYEISKDDLNNLDKVNEFSEKIGEIVINKDETITVSGLYKKVEYDKKLESELAVDITAPVRQYGDDGKIHTYTNLVTVIPVEVGAIPESEPKATLDVKFVDEQGTLLPGNVSVGTYVGVNYALTADSANMKNVAIKDTGIGFEISNDGIVIPEDFEINNVLKVEVIDNEGNVKETISLSEADITNNTDAYKNLLNKLGNGDDAWELNTGDQITVTGLYKNIGTEAIEANAKSDITGPVPTYNEVTDSITVIYETVSPTDSSKVDVKPYANVKFEINAEEGSLDGKTEYIVDNGTTVGTQPEVNENEGYEFEKWTMTTGGETTDVEGEPKDVVITGDTVFTAVLSPKNYEYTVKYVDKTTGEEIAESKTTSGTFKTEVTENAIDIKGYGVSGESEKKITINTSGNEIIFEYEKGKYPYTVKYVDKATGEEIAEAKTSNATFNATVTENAIDIPKYTVSGDSEQSIVIDTENNEIVFQYEKNKVNVEFKADSNGTVTGELQQSVEIDGKVSSVATPVPDEGYEFNGWVKTTTDGTIVSENPAEEVITEDTVFTAKFTPKDYNYIVKYVDKDTGKELATSKTGEATFGTDVTEKAVSIEGYTLTSNAEQQITIKVSGNEIIFEYVINKFNVKFEADKNGTVEGDLDQTVNYKDTVASVATPVPDKGYEFLGWEKTTSDGTIISEKPGKEVITEDTVFTAKFGPLDYGYVVKYVDEEGNALLPETHGEETTFGTEVSAEAVEITGYTVDEQNKSIVIDTENNEIVFVYTKKVYDVIFNTDGNGKIDGTSEMKVKFEETVEKVPGNTANEGYSFTGWTMVAGDVEEVVVEDPATVKITENTVFTAHYEINSYDYVIKYVDEDGNSISPNVVKSAVYGTTVTESPITIEGYNTKDSDKSIVIKVEGNEIVFVYVKDADETPSSDRNVNVKDASDEKNEGYGYGKKTKGDDSEDNEGDGAGESGQRNDGTISPKTGNIMLIFAVFGSLMMAIMCVICSLLKLRKYSTK